MISGKSLDSIQVGGLYAFRGSSALDSPVIVDKLAIGYAHWHSVLWATKAKRAGKAEIAYFSKYYVPAVIEPWVTRVVEFGEELETIRRGSIVIDASGKLLRAGRGTFKPLEGYKPVDPVLPVEVLSFRESDGPGLGKRDISSLVDIHLERVELLNGMVVS